MCLLLHTGRVAWTLSKVQLKLITSNRSELSIKAFVISLWSRHMGDRSWEKINEITRFNNYNFDTAYLGLEFDKWYQVQLLNSHENEYSYDAITRLYDASTKRFLTANEWTDRKTDRLTRRLAGKQKDRQLDEQTKRQINRWMDELQKDRYLL